ncbi:L-threonylcarbamoyladenylate synthase [Pontibacter sp. G13]|uniref:L-threonylcarbamoyladenylate synthase n=1 Tax=Pontibacter sp. G13 TaxID=3074898 RepID=UPI00288BB14D|nr:L-threonylcarbamoyladenylate synthase [Pontibacter sp. G13]WNJ21418.1 L-threonylcarbamoyladenylate synthase [Pontibacter sp. G13]
MTPPAGSLMDHCTHLTVFTNMILKIHPDNPQGRHIDRVVECLRDGGVIIYPTDTVYGLGCDINNKKAVERICRIKGIDPKKSHLSCVCEDLAIIGTYANHVTTPMYKLMKAALPGPYTFILEASKMIPKHFQHKKTFGIRVADHSIPKILCEQLGNPIASISLPMDENQPEFSNDPELIYQRYMKEVDIVVDCGVGGIAASTVIDLSNGEQDIEVIREGKGSLEEIGLVF